MSLSQRLRKPALKPRDGHEGEEREQPSFGCPCGALKPRRKSLLSVKLTMKAL